MESRPIFWKNLTILTGQVDSPKNREFGLRIVPGRLVVISDHIMIQIELNTGLGVESHQRLLIGVLLPGIRRT